MKPLELKTRPMLFRPYSLVDTVRVNHVYQHFIIKSRYETKIITDCLALLWEYAGSACRR